MKIYLADEVTEIDNPDLTKGYIKQKEKTIHHEAVKAVEKVSHYEVIKEYPNGVKDLEEKIDIEPVEAKDAYDEKIAYQIYNEWTTDELRYFELQADKGKYHAALANSDYKAIKYAEGWLSEEDFAEIKVERQSYRDKINEIDKELATLKDPYVVEEA